MFGIGMPEMLLLFAVALIVFGPKKLPELAKSLGRALGEFKRATSDLKESIESETGIGEVRDNFKDVAQEIKTPAKVAGDVPDPTPVDGDATGPASKDGDVPAESAQPQENVSAGSEQYNADAAEPANFSRSDDSSPSRRQASQSQDGTCSGG